MKKGKPPSQTAQQQFGQEQQARDTAAGTAGQTLQATQTALSPYLAGSAGMSDFRRNLANQMGTSLASANENNLASIRNRAAAAGFGYSQPITAQAEIGAGTQGRLAQSQIPLQVEQTAAPLELGAANQLAGVGAQQANIARMYNPQQYFNDYMQAAEQERQQKGGLFGALAGIGASLIPGVGGILGPAVGGLFKKKPSLAPDIPYGSVYGPPQG